MFSQVGIYDCANARDPGHEPVLVALAASQRARDIRALVTAPHARTEACLAHLPGFCLQA